MPTGSVPTAVKTYVTEYSVRQRNEIVDTIPEVVNETLRIADLTDVPTIAEKMTEMTSQVKKDVKDEVVNATAEIPTLVRNALEDYQMSKNTRDDDRLEAAKKELMTWLEDNLRKEVASMVSAAVKPYMQTIEDLSAKVVMLQRDLTVLMMAHDGDRDEPVVRVVTVKPHAGEERYANNTDDRTSGNVRPAAPDGGRGSDDESSDGSRKSHRSSRRGRDRRRRDSDREDRRRHQRFSSDDADASPSSGDDSDRPRHVTSFRSWKPTDHRYQKACDYRTYRLERGRGRIDSRTNRNTRKKFNDLEVTMVGNKFDARDPIRIIGFLRRLKRDGDNNDMTECSLYLALLYMLKGEAQDAFEAAQDDGSSRRNVQDWIVACDWLLHTYATNANIADAFMDLSSTRQGPEEDETRFSTRLRNSVKRCGNAHSEYEVATLFVQGLIPAISPRVAQESSRRPRMEYVDLVQFTRSEGDAVRAQGRLGKPRLSFSDNLPRRTVNLIEDDANGNQSTATGSASACASAAEVSLIGDGDHSVSAPSYFSAVETDGPESEALYANQARFPRTRFDRFRREAPSHGGSELICYECYLPGHVSTRCEMKLKDMYQVPENFLKLTDE